MTSGASDFGDKGPLGEDDLDLGTKVRLARDSVLLFDSDVFV